MQVSLKVANSHKVFLKSDGNMKVKLSKILQKHLTGYVRSHPKGEKKKTIIDLDDKSARLLKDFSRVLDVSPSEIVRGVIEMEIAENE